MEAIKCPNCGSEKVRELTEEKYQCEACDNVFLVHNLSKEFRETDKHLGDVHKDLKEAINNISINGGSSETDAEFENAFHLIEIGKYEMALEKFRILCEKRSMTYRPWWGRILAMTQNLKSKDEDLICSPEMLECIDNMRRSNDYSEETEEKLCAYLEQVFTEHKASVERQLSDLQQSMEVSAEQLSQKQSEENEFKGRADEKLMLKSKINKMTTVQVIATAICLVLSEGVVISKLFFGWLKHSIDVINQPLPDPSAAEAGSALGNAALNLLAIPFKFIIGVGVVIGAAVLVFYILTFIFSITKSGTSAKIDKMDLEGKDIAKSIEEMQYYLKADNKTKRKLEKHIELYDRIDCKNLETLENYRSIKKNFEV